MLVLTPVGAGQGTFPPGASIEVFSYAVIGGLGSVAGAMSGVFFFRLLDFVLAKQFSGEVVDDPALQPLRAPASSSSSTSCPAGCGSSCSAGATATCAGSPTGDGLLVPSLVADKRVTRDEDEPEDETSVIAGALS